METKIALTKDKEADEVDVYLYRSMIGSLMYLTASRLPKLITKVDSLEKELKQTKLTMVKAIVKLVKKMEV
ncbi:hypothetical protein Tco_0623706, partial [Tanacetum coccineum]